MTVKQQSECLEDIFVMINHSIEITTTAVAIVKYSTGYTRELYTHLDIGSSCPIFGDNY